MDRSLRKKIPLRDLKTIGATRAPRWDRCDYRGDEIIHATICADSGRPLDEPEFARLVCDSVETSCKNLRFRLFGYCLMPDHLHALLSPNHSGRFLADWLQSFKSFTAHWFKKNRAGGKLWRRLAYDHVCKRDETAETVMRYIAENPVRRGLVAGWRQWPWTRVFIEI